VTKTHSRPYTSTDNPYSEAHFKTLKYDQVLESQALKELARGNW
jgi:hypothetical protein